MTWCVYGDRHPATGWRLFATPARPLGYWLPVCARHHPEPVELAA
jgi:hypothetical protein